MKKRLLALMMALAMVLPILSIGAWADETADEEELLLEEELELTEEET